LPRANPNGGLGGWRWHQTRGWLVAFHPRFFVTLLKRNFLGMNHQARGYP